MGKSICKIVLTGGPCAGKTTMMNRIVSEFSEKGYKVIVCPEGATELIPNGIIPGQNGITMERYQYFIVQKQLDKEALYDAIAQEMTDEKVIIMYDRGLMDGQSYVTPEFFDQVLSHFKLDRSGVMGRYDAVIHLVSAAKGGENMYDKGSNAARQEDVELACQVDDKTLVSWIGHPHLRVVENSQDFEVKIQSALHEVYSVLGEPAPVEIENKYEVRVPDAWTLLSKGAVKTHIIQTYLMSLEEGVERRVRRTEIGDSGEYIYSYTEKSELGSNGRSERERKITYREYEHLVKEADVSLYQIIKTRYCFVYKSQYFELDIYNGDFAVMEIELTDADQQVELPDFIEVIKDVTGDKRYRNKSIAEHGFPNVN